MTVSPHTVIARYRQMSLKDTEIKHAKPKEKPYKLADGGGLYLQVTVTGGKYWRYDYRHADKRKTLALGVYPDTTLAKAREKHIEARAMLLEGIDPGEDKKAKRKAKDTASANTFRAVATKWHAYWKKGLTERYADQVWTRLEADVLPAIGDAPLTELTAGRFKDLVQQIEKRGAADIAKRTLQTCKQIMRYAVTHDYLPSNPAADIQPRDILPKRKKRNYPRVSPSELPELLRRIDAYEGAEVTVLAMRFLTYTFVRTGELIRARWEELDLQAKRWNIPPERMKMDRPHIVPLARQALEILETMKGYDNGSGYIFPTDTYGKGLHMSNNTVLYALYRMGYRGRMTGHGFRGVASTILHEQGYNHDHIELQLAHAEDSDDTSAAYNYAEYLPQRTRMMQDWADYVDAIKQTTVIAFPAREA